MRLFHCQHKEVDVFFIGEVIMLADTSLPFYKLKGSGHSATLLH